MLKTSHRPDGKNAYALALILACTTAANASCHLPQWEFLLICPIDSHLSIRIHIWFYQGNVRATPANFTSPPWELLKFQAQIARTPVW